MAEPPDYDAISPYTLAGVTSLLNVGNEPRIDKEAAKGYLSKLQGEGKKYSDQYDDATARRQAEVDRAKSILEQTTNSLKAQRSDPWRANLPLLALASGLLSPTKTGTFGEGLGYGLGAYGPALARDRASDENYFKTLGDLGVQSAALGEAPIKDEQKLRQAQILQNTQNERQAEVAALRISGKLSPVAQLALDLKEGRITKEEHDAAFKKLTNVADAKDTALIQEHKNAVAAGYKGTLLDFVSEKAKSQAAGKEQGELGTQAAIALPAAIANSEQSLKKIGELKGHPGIANAVGNIQSYLPAMPGTDKADFLATLENIKGRNFLQAFESLKGAGAITDIEGKKATDAIANLGVHQSKKQFLATLDELEGIIKAGQERARTKAAAAAPNPSGTAKPAAPSVVTKPAFTPPEGGTHIGNTPDGKPVFKMPDGTQVVPQ